MKTRATSVGGPSLGVKLAVATAAVLAIVSSLVFHELSVRAQDHLLTAKRQAAELVTDLFAVSAVAPLDFGDDGDLHNVLENLRVNKQITYAAIWRQGSPLPAATLGQPGRERLPFPDHLSRAETRLTADSLEITRPIQRSDGSALGAVAVRFSLASVFTDLQAERRTALVGTTGTAALVVLLIVAAARFQIVLPLERLGLAVRRLQNGEENVTVDVHTSDEIGRLAGAFNTMSAAIVDRERHLARAMARLRELFDHMRQGIVVFGPDGVIDEAPSKHASSLFGPDVAGRRIDDLFYGDVLDGSPTRQAFEEWIACAFDVPLEEWGAFAALAPTLVQRKQDGNPQWLELQFAPVVREGRLGRIMALATDVTSQRELERTAQTLEESHARQMGAMRRLVAGGGQVFASFLESAEARLKGSLDRVKSAALDSRAITEALEGIHTIRGEARTFELPELASECQGLERSLREMKDNGETPAPEELATIGARIEHALGTVNAARDLFVAASPIGRAVLDQMTVRRSDVKRLSEELGVTSDGVRRAIENLTSRPFGECVAGLESAAPRWAREAGKAARVVVEGGDVRVPAKVAPVLSAMLPHLVRNAIAHGIEGPDARRDSGKRAEGTVELAAVSDAAHLVVRVRDDGAGLDESSIVAEARRLGVTGAAASELLFAPGLSTAKEVEELAGQGLGLSAVREGLRSVGGVIHIVSREMRGVEFEIKVPLRRTGNTG